MKAPTHRMKGAKVAKQIDAETYAKICKDLAAIGVGAAVLGVIVSLVDALSRCPDQVLYALFALLILAGCWAIGQFGVRVTHEERRGVK